jgi:hypothetical protein
MRRRRGQVWLLPDPSAQRGETARDLDGPTDVSLWIIQRDERLGVHAYEACVHVTP